MVIDLDEYEIIAAHSFSIVDFEFRRAFSRNRVRTERVQYCTSLDNNSIAVWYVQGEEEEEEERKEHFQYR
jgi:hypothetical protein